MTTLAGGAVAELAVADGFKTSVARKSVKAVHEFPDGCQIVTAEGERIFTMDSYEVVMAWWTGKEEGNGTS